jgi:hypothetical protein
MFHLALFIVTLRLCRVKPLSYRRHALKNPGGLGAEPPESTTEEEILTLPLDYLLDGRSPLYSGERGERGVRGGSRVRSTLPLNGHTDRHSRLARLFAIVICV